MSVSYNRTREHNFQQWQSTRWVDVCVLRYVSHYDILRPCAAIMWLGPVLSEQTQNEIWRREWDNVRLDDCFSRNHLDSRKTRPGYALRLHRWPFYIHDYILCDFYIFNYFAICCWASTLRARVALEATPVRRRHVDLMMPPGSKNARVVTLK